MITFPEIDVYAISLLIRPIVLALFCSFLFASIFFFSSQRTVNWADDWLRNLRDATAFSMPVVVLGYTAGYLTGLSRSPAIGTTLPAALSLVGGLAIYTFGTQTQYKLIIGYCVLMFAMSLFYGSQIGATTHQYGLEFRLKVLADQEKAINIHRKNLGLPKDPPSWMMGIDKKD